MKSTNVENAMDTSHAAEAERVVGETVINKNPYGKFKDAESLLKAYESLESEFTRRSQRLKAIEGELEDRFQKEKTVDKVEGKIDEKKDFLGRYPNSSQFEKEIESELSCGLQKREEAYIKILERKLNDAKNKPIEKSEKDDQIGKDFSAIVIKEYLKKIMQEKPKSKVLCGVSISVPPLKPTTVAEASALAKNYIRRKGE